MNIANPRRVLLLGPPDSGVLPLLKDLTGSQPQPRPLDTNTTTTTSTAGLTHTLDIKTKYYTTSLPLWLDEPTSPATWRSDFLAPEAAEVIRAVGAWVIVFKLDGTEAYKTQIKELISAVADVIEAAYIEEGGADAWDGVLLAVSMGSEGVRSSDAGLKGVEEKEREHDEWDGVCLENGFEYVDGLAASSGGEKKGVERVREALEANDWSNLVEGFADGDDDDGSGDDIDGDTLGMRKEKAELSAEFAGLKMEMQREDEQDDDDENEELQVEELEKMMRHLQAARDMSAHLPEAQRKKFAEKAVNDLLKDLS